MEYAVDSYQIAQAAFPSHSEVCKLIRTAERRRIKEGGQPFAQGTIHPPRLGKPLEVYLLTDDDVRYISQHTCSSFWVAFCFRNPDWMPPGADVRQLAVRVIKGDEKRAKRRASRRAIADKEKKERLAIRRARIETRETMRRRIDALNRARREEREAKRRLRREERESPEAIRRMQEAKKRRREALNVYNDTLRAEQRAAQRKLEAAREEKELEAAGLYTFKRAAVRVHLPPGESLSTFLERRRVIVYQRGECRLLPPYEGHGYTDRAIIRIGRERDTPCEVTVWTRAGLDFLRRVIRGAKADPFDGQWDWHEPPVY